MLRLAPVERARTAAGARLAAILTSLLALSSCIGADVGTQLEEGRWASVLIQPALIPSAADAGAAPINRIRTVTTRESDDAVIDVTELDVSPTANSWSVVLSLPTSADGTVVMVLLVLINVSGDGTETIEFSGRSDPIELVPGGEFTPDVPFVRGPAANLSVTGITILDPPSNMEPGTSQTLQGSVSTSDQSQPITFWTSLDPAVLSLDGTVATAVTSGVAGVVASAGAFADTAFISVGRVLEDYILVGADGVGDIYLIDEATGAGTLLIDTSTDDGIGGTTDVGVVSSMSYIPTTDVWWLGTGGTGTCEQCIQVLDPSTGLATTLYVRQRFGGYSGMAVHPSNDKIYTFESDGSRDLYEIDPVTGVDSLLFDTLSVQSGGKGTTFSADEVLYVAGDGDLFSVDEVTGGFALVGDITLTSFPVSTVSPDKSLATRPADGVIFGIAWDGNRRNHNAAYLFTLDVATGEATFVGQTVDLLEGLAFVPSSLITP